MADSAVTGQVTAGRSEPEYIVRFNVRQRVEHAILMVVFIMLALTGLAQKFYTAGWAEWLILNMGGITYTRLIHRILALVFSLGILYHFKFVLYSFFVRHDRLSMLPTLKDFRDVVASLQYSFGAAGRPPRFGRYDYRQKFEYWGIIFGSLIIIISGFILAFPILVTQWLPGQLVAAAKEFHGNEAMLAVLTIVVWHLYDVIFRPEIFPADTSIFTGKIPRKRMREEHSLEYAELTGQSPEEAATTPGDLPPANSATG